MALSNAQYDEIIREYDARRIYNQHIVEQRRSELYKEEPRLAEIDDTIASYSVSQALKILEGDTNALSELKDELKNLQKSKADIMRTLGYDENYFTPPYRCPDCRDTGYIGNKRCHCFEQAAIDLVYTQSHLKEVLQKENFKTFTLDYYSKDYIDESTGISAYDRAKMALQIAYNFIEHFETENQNLFFYGNAGVGKTFLSNCIAKELLDRGHSVIYFTAAQLFDIFEKDVFKKDTNSGEARQNIYNCDLLIIDDLGTEVANSFTASQLYLCVNERMLRKRSTIISTNLNMRQISDHYSERTFSRISSNYTTVRFFGEDIRLVKKLQNCR